MTPEDMFIIGEASIGIGIIIWVFSIWILVVNKSKHNTGDYQMTKPPDLKFIRVECCTNCCHHYIDREEDHDDDVCGKHDFTLNSPMWHCSDYKHKVIE